MRFLMRWLVWWGLIHALLWLGGVTFVLDQVTAERLNGVGGVVMVWYTPGLVAFVLAILSSWWLPILCVLVGFWFGFSRSR